MTYPPAYYTDDNPDFARRIMADHSFALLIIEGLEATHLPLIHREEPDGAGILEGHLSRQNPIAKTLLERSEPLSALAVFSGPHGYVSANLYDKPNASVPTWNYASVQARGHLEILPEASSLHHLQNLALIYEGPDGWSVSDAPDYVAKIQRGILAVQLKVKTLQAFRKMSGNKPPAIQKRIIDAARLAGEHAFADEMARAHDEASNRKETE